MSAFLGFESYLVPLGASLSDVRTTLISSLTTYNWQILRKSLQPLAVIGTIVNPANAMDNNYQNQAGSAVTSVTLGVQMAAGFTPTEMFITNHAVQGNAPRTFTLDYSDNGSSWTTLQTWSDEINWGQFEQRKFTVSGAASHAYWRISVTAINGGTGTYINEWALKDASNNWVTNAQFFDFIPPATETIGDANFLEFARCEIAATTLTFKSNLQAVLATPGVLGVYGSVAGAVACALTINGVTVTGATGSAGTTADGNSRALYEAIRASADANFVAYDWEYQKAATQNADQASSFIYGVRKIGGVNDLVATNANCSLYSRHFATGAGTYQALVPPAGIGSLTVDLTNGFIVYIQVCARGIAISTKTTVAVYGPHFIGWGDNAKACASIPSPWFSYACAPVELVVGYTNGITDCAGVGYPTHTIAIPAMTFLTDTTNMVSATQGSGSSFGRGMIRDKFQNHTGSGTTIGAAYQSIYAGAYGSNFFSGVDSVGNDFQVHRLTLYEAFNSTNVIGSPNNPIRQIIPSVHLDDWYKWVGTATDESLVLVADTVLTTSANADIAIGDTSVSVASTTGFASAGFIVIESEILQYTGLSGGNTFTGVTRGKYGTVATAHWSGDAVAQGGWFVKMNGGALFAGYVKPT